MSVSKVYEERKDLEVAEIKTIQDGWWIWLKSGYGVDILKNQTLYDSFGQELVVWGTDTDDGEKMDFKASDIESIYKRERGGADTIIAQTHEPLRTFTYGEMYQYIKNYLKTHARWTDILDYDLTACETNDRKIICAEEELNWEVEPGDEGYYLDISICDYNGEKKPIATLKTLIECDESYRKMVMLGAEFKIAHKSVWLKEKEPYINRYGYNLVFYSKENKMKYYIHFEGDRQSAVQWAEEKCKEYRKNNQLDSASLFDLKTVTAIRTFQ